MSIPSSYLTTMAWEKFVEKHDAFMRNFKIKCPQLTTMDSLLISDKIGFDFAGDHV